MAVLTQPTQAAMLKRARQAQHAAWRERQEERRMLLGMDSDDDLESSVGSRVRVRVLGLNPKQVQCSPE